MDPIVLNALRDPAGLPFYPVVFLILGALTFALHIAAVQLMLGASALTVIGAYRQDGNWRRLAGSMLDVAKIAVSVAIVIGVAPLLFVQVTYDPFWYTSNVLSAKWVIYFILILIVGYWLMYVFYFKNRGNLADHTPRYRWTMPASVALLLVVGFIMHVLTTQMLYPEQWMQWYAPGGELDTSGSGIHHFNLWRFGFFIAMAVPVVGAWLVAYRRYFSARSDSDQNYLLWAEGLGYRLMQYGVPVVLLLGAAWMLTLHENQAGFAGSLWVWASLLAIVGAWGAGLWTRGKGGLTGYVPFLALLVAGIVIAAAREALRYGVLHGVHGYGVFDYKLNLDWYSTVLFFITFAVVGGMTLAYLLTLSWKAGQTVGVYTPSRAVHRMGQWSAALIVLWIVQYFAIGFWVWAR